MNETRASILRADQKLFRRSPTNPRVKEFVGTAKKMLEEVDRQVGGEYERREEGSSAAAADGPPGAGHDTAGRTPEPPVARAQVEAEQERFDGLVNEPANPPREPGLERTS